MEKQKKYYHDDCKTWVPGFKFIELLVVTQVDIDHIDGIIRLLNQYKIPYKFKEISFNGKMSKNIRNKRTFFKVIM